MPESEKQGKNKKERKEKELFVNNELTRRAYSLNDSFNKST